VKEIFVRVLLQLDDGDVNTWVAIGRGRSETGAVPMRSTRLHGPNEGVAFYWKGISGNEMSCRTDCNPRIVDTKREADGGVAPVGPNP